MKKLLNSVEEIRRKMRVRFDADEEQENNNKNNKKRGKKHSAFSTRLPYGLCKDLGIDTEGMTPREAWDAYYGKTGISPSKIKAQKMGTDMPNESEDKDIEIGGTLKELADAGGLKKQPDGTYLNPLTGELFTKEEADKINKRVSDASLSKENYLSKVIKMSGGFDPEGLRDRLKDGDAIESLVPSDSAEEIADACEKYFSEKGDEENAHLFGRVSKKTRAKKETDRIKSEIDAISTGDIHPERHTDRAIEILKSAPPHTEITLMGTPYSKREDGTWEKVYYGSKSTVDDHDVEFEMWRTTHTSWEGYKPKVRVRSPIKLSKRDAKDWYEELPTSVLAYDEIGEELDSMPNGSTILTPGYSRGEIDSFAYKKDGEWRTFGGYVGGARVALRALSDAKYRDAHGSGIGSDCISFPDDDTKPTKKPESDLDKKLTEKLKGDSDSVEKALRALKPGDKITVECGGHSIEYERVKGGIRKDGHYGKVEFYELARGLSGVSGVDSVGVTVTGVPRPKPIPKTPEEKAAAAERRAAREKIKAEMAKPYVPSGAKYESPDTLSNFDNTMATRSTTLKDHYGLSDADVDLLRKGFRKMFETHEYGMRFDGAVLENIMNTHFMNQMESKKSHGWHNEFGRARASRQLFGHEQQLDRAGIGGNGDSFEKYGYMPDDPIHDITHGARASWYGGVLATFKKDRVQSRTTYTCDDSLGEAGRTWSSPARVGEDPGWEGATCADVKRTLQRFKDAVATGRDVKPSEVAVSYLELQYHGRITMDDVDALYFESDDATYLTGELEGRLKEKGIRIYVVGRGWI